MIGLHCGAVASLAALAAASLWRGRGLELLPLNQGEGPWLWLALWGAFSVVIALPRVPRVAWRVGLGACSATLVLAASVGAWQRSALWAAVGASALVLALGSAALVFVLRAPTDRRRARGQTGRADAPQARALAPSAARESLARALPAALWLACAATFVLSFSWARWGKDEAVEATGHAGMLVCIFLQLPGLMLRAWFRRTAALLWCLAAISWLALGARAERGVLGWLAAPIAAGALVLVLRRGSPQRSDASEADLDEARA